MKINWKVRLRHPAFITAVCALIGYILVDSAVIDAGQWELYVQLVLAVLVAGGVIIDPTTEKLSDSRQALTYESPKKG